MTTNPKNDAERQADWARQVLECSPDEPRSETIARLLNWTEESDFYPEQHWPDAYKSLDPATSDLSEQCLTESYRHHREQELRVAIEEFAGEFFSLDTEARTRRYQELSNEAADFPRATARLKSLLIGLQVDPDIDDEPDDVKELAQAILELFVLSPRSRSARLAERSHLFPQERQTAKTLKNRCPQIAALMPSVIERVIEARKHPWRIRGVKAPAVAQGDPEGAWLGYFSLIVPIGAALMLGISFVQHIFDSDDDKDKQKNRSTMTSQERVDEFVDESERMRRLIANAVTKDIEDLTDEERKHYEHMGFFEDDESLQSYKASNLMFYQLDELRKAWRRVHARELQRLQEQQVDEEPVDKSGQVEENDPTLEIVE